MSRTVGIALVRANTGLAGTARLLTGYEYTHCAVCLDDTWEEFLTFSRRRHYAPFDAGFTREKRNSYAYGKNRNVKLKLFRIPVSEEQYGEAARFISETERQDPPFDIWGMVTMPLLHGIAHPGVKNCMSFTAEVIALCGIPLDRPACRYSIRDIDALLKGIPHTTAVFEKTPDSEEDYMRPSSPLQNIRDFVRLNRRWFNC